MSLKRQLVHKDNELELKEKELKCARLEAALAAKSEMHEKVNDAFQKGVSYAHGTMKILHSRSHGPPSSARMASLGSTSRLSSSSFDHYEEF